MGSIVDTAFFVIAALIGAGITYLIMRKTIHSLRIRGTQQDETIRRLTEERSVAVTKLERLEELKGALDDRNRKIQELSDTITSLREHQAELATTLEKERTNTVEKLKILDEASAKMQDAFKALSSEALKSNNESFLSMARTILEKYQEEAQSDLHQRQEAVKGIVKPVAESLDKFDTHIRELEKNRADAFGSLREQIRGLTKAQQQLQRETGNLVQALRTPQVRGRWGEITLKRVAELAGMLEHCDFYEQESVDTDQGKMRPDMVVKLPNDRQIVVDAKAPLSAYLEAVEAGDDETRKQRLIAHSRQIQQHMKALGQKSYWSQFQPTPEFVVMFIPGENFFSAALEYNPGIIEEGVSKGVILSTPTTLISLLKAVAFGWRHETMAANAEAISTLGKELYERLGTLTEHLNRLGGNLEKSITSYNKLIGSYERRVISAARKFTDLGIRAKDGKELPELESSDTGIRQVDSGK